MSELPGALLLLTGLALLAAIVWLVVQTRAAMGQWYDRASQRTLERFRARIEPFKFARRHMVQTALLQDPEVISAIERHASARGVSPEETRREVVSYIREMVPSFNVLSYYRFGYGLSRWFIGLLYRLVVHNRDAAAPGRIPPNDVVVYLANHRSNADYVVIAYVLAGTVSISYAVGEWARTWPLEYLFKSFGSYFIRRRYRVPLYHTVLERYVRLITTNGVTQGIFPEGRLTRDGAMLPPKIGLLDYLLGSLADPRFEGRSIWLVPVALNYDRVLEDRSLIQERIVGGSRPGRVRQFTSLVRYLSHNLVRLALGRFRRYGTVAVAFGAPLSLRRWLDSQPAGLLSFPREQRLPLVQGLAEQAAEAIAEVIPVTPVPLAATALLSFGGSAVRRGDLLDRLDDLRDQLVERGAVLSDPDLTVEELWLTAWRQLRLRR